GRGRGHVPEPLRALQRPAGGRARGDRRCRALQRPARPGARDGMIEPLTNLLGGLYAAFRDAVMNLAFEGTLPAALRYNFVVDALLCAFLIGPVLGGVGTMVVTKRMAFFSQAIGNAAMTGVAIGVLLGEPYTEPYMSMFGFCILFGLLLNYTKDRTRIPSDTLIGVFLSISLAVGASLLLFVSARVNTHIL